VFSKHKSTEVVRSYQPLVTNPKTPGQQQTRAQFSAIIEFLKNFPSPILSDGLLNSSSKKSTFNQLLKLNFKTFLPSDPNPLQSFNFVANPDFTINVNSCTYDPLFDLFSCVYSQQDTNKFPFSSNLISVLSYNNFSNSLNSPLYRGWAGLNGVFTCMIEDRINKMDMFYDNYFSNGYLYQMTGTYGFSW
jgi:hypothetical protein